MKTLAGFVVFALAAAGAVGLIAQSTQPRQLNG